MLQHGDQRKLSGGWGVLGLVLYIWAWDSTQHTISSWFWGKHPLVGAAVFGYIFSHVVFKRPRKVLIKW